MAQEFSSLDEDAWKAQDARDEREIARLLEQSQEGGSGGLTLDDTPFDQTNKADDAQDFEDISDDDLPDEEPGVSTSLELPGLTDDGGTSNDADDLFGEGPSSPSDPILATDSQPALLFPGIINTAGAQDGKNHLDGAVNQDPDIPAPAETIEDLIKATYPAFVKGRTVKWNKAQLFPNETQDENTIELADESDSELVVEAADAAYDANKAAEKESVIKRRRIVKKGLPEIPRWAAPSFDNHEQMTARGAKRVYLDSSDPYLLIETERFNLSNDEAYEMLKENHQNKLTWPYYKVKLAGTTDEYHHLSMNDNSTAVLFEYCEPRPRVLNNFGMGNRLINYYRRKDTNDEDQLPKQELGEYRMLLPEDRSPFSLFGTVDPGETVPTLHNEMFRAPVFKHNPRDTDFLVVRNTTGIEGSHWYLRKIDHLHVVGQAFPMKMLAFRLIRHSETDNCQLADITKHIADSTDTQNRQKLKEFLQYDRDSVEKGMWRLKAGEILPDENAIRAMIKPEEVSLLDAMQLGIKELEDAGYDPRNANIDDEQMADADAEEEEVDDEASKLTKGAKKAAEKQEETLADKMAPWKTTKAFIDACAQKAMLQLHGEGDPTGHGLGFSFIRTSMKGGYIEAVQGPLATSADAMEREKRANGGHAYNVKKQQAMYEEGIREIWEKQRASLSDGREHDDKDVAVTEDEDERFNVNANTAATPAHFDEGFSQISGFTSSSRHLKRAIRITREVQMADGTRQKRIEVVHDPVVISQYMKRRTEADLESKDIYTSRPTGNADHDRLANLRIKKELERLEKNKARRQAREQQKELHQKAHAGDALSPGAGGIDKIATGTTRKCANCGQVGHIKTNKKLCPLLNGTMKTDKSSAEHGGFGNYNASGMGLGAGSPAS
ncbi:hypothetical protein CDD81_6299 [Ophiocordyceps australis]|uniref:Transcription initiation factor TFIID subunit 1 histone acetyltransferase domain-containing protein n=1 Tax=Ophiocordyceps australis TaxID=1399860 RepID=A0A2C5Y7W7_9HYPO|nr:hypothetical protein CDD81_6299 [Ophiocordyceps australis]